jgi:hypothetical protein
LRGARRFERTARPVRRDARAIAASFMRKVRGTWPSHMAVRWSPFILPFCCEVFRHGRGRFR